MAAAMVISGTIGWVVVSTGQPVVVLIFWRCVFGFICLLTICAALGHLRLLTWRRLGWSALGGVAIISNWLLLFGAYSHVPISIATAIYNTQPFMLVALGILFLRERLELQRVAWMILAFAGVLLISQGKSAGYVQDGNYLAGIVMALGAAFFYALAALVAKKLTGTPPQLVAMIQVVVGMLMLAPWALTSEFPAQAETWAAFIALGVVYTGLVYILLYGALQKLPTSVAGGLSFLYPVVAMLVDYFALGQRLDVAQTAGATTVLFAAAGMTLGRRQQR